MVLVLIDKLVDDKFSSEIGFEGNADFKGAPTSVSRLPGPNHSAPSLSRLAVVDAGYGSTSHTWKGNCSNKNYELT